MCYLVSSVPPPANGVRAPQLVIFETDPTPGAQSAEFRAKIEAERLLRAGFSDVRVWKHFDTPTLQQVVQWAGPLSEGGDAL